MAHMISGLAKRSLMDMIKPTYNRVNVHGWYMSRSRFRNYLQTCTGVCVSLFDLRIQLNPRASNNNTIKGTSAGYSQERGVAGIDPSTRGRRPMVLEVPFRSRD